MVSLTPEGAELRDRALSVPSEMAACVALTPNEAQTLQRLLKKLISGAE